MYELTSENLTGLGSAMGTERTWTNWRSFHTTLAGAKAKAKADYTNGLPWEWIQEGTGCRSPDLAYVMYRIREINIEE